MSLGVRLLVVPRNRHSTVPAGPVSSVLRTLDMLGSEYPATDHHTSRFSPGRAAALDSTEIGTLAVTCASEPFLSVRSESIDEVPGICDCGSVLWRGGQGEYDYLLATCPACGSPFDPHREVATARDPWTNESIDVPAGTCHRIGLVLELDHIPDEPPTLDRALQTALEAALGPLDQLWLA